MENLVIPHSQKDAAFRQELSNKISFLMLICTFVIVMFHSGLRYYYPFIEDLTAISNSYFFYISAFFFYRGLNNKNVYLLLKKRIITLLLPYLLWNITYAILFYNISDFNFFNILNGLTVNPYCQPSWYLLTLFIFFVFSIFIRKLFKKIYLIVIVLSIGMTISYCGYVAFQVEIASIPVVGGYLIRMSEYFTPYLIGGIIGTWAGDKINTNLKKNIFGLVTSIIIILLLQCNITHGLRWLLWITFPLTLWTAIPEKIFIPTKFLQWFTKPTFFINMIHCMFLNIWPIIVTKYIQISEKRCSLLSVIFTLITSYIIYYILKFFIPPILQIYTGYRGEKQ